MVKALFNVILDMLASVIQIIVWPINTLISATLPDLSEMIQQVSTTLGSVFNSLSWAIGLVPTPIISVLIFIIGVEIAKHTIYISTHTLIKVWNVFQKIKFW